MKLHPIIAKRISADLPAVPEGFTELHHTISSGLPEKLSLDGSSITAILAVATGRVRHWLDLEGTETVSSSQHEVKPVAAYTTPVGERFPFGEQAAIPFNIYLRKGDQTLGVMPVVAGSRKIFPNTERETTSPIVELLVLDHGLTAQALKGAGESGAWIRLAWRKLGGTAPFPAPIARRSVQLRLASAPSKQQMSETVASTLSTDVSSGDGATPVGGVHWKAVTRGD